MNVNYRFGFLIGTFAIVSESVSERLRIAVSQSFFLAWAEFKVWKLLKYLCTWFNSTARDKTEATLLGNLCDTYF